MLNNIKLSKVSQTSTVLTKTEFNSQSLTSLQIAELTGKKHSHVMRDIRKMFESLESQSKFGQTSYEDEQGKINPMYLLDESESLTLASGYNVKMRKSIIDSWLEMKNQEIKPVKPLTNLEMLEIAVAEIKAGQFALELEQKAHSQTKEVLEHKQAIIVEIALRVPAKTMRSNINEIVRKYAFGGIYDKVWRKLYGEFLSIYHHDIPRVHKNMVESNEIKMRIDRYGKKSYSKSILEVAEQKGYLEDLYNLAIKLFEIKENTDKNQLQLA